MIDVALWFEYFLIYLMGPPTFHCYMVGFTIGGQPEIFIGFPGKYAIATAILGIVAWHILVTKMIFGRLPEWVRFIIYGPWQGPCLDIARKEKYYGIFDKKTCDNLVDLHIRIGWVLYWITFCSVFTGFLIFVTAWVWVLVNVGGFRVVW